MRQVAVELRLDAVAGRLGPPLGSLVGNDNVPQYPPGARRIAGWKAQHIGRGIGAAPAAVEPPNRRISHHKDGELAAAQGKAPQKPPRAARQRRAAPPGPVITHLDLHLICSRRAAARRGPSSGRSQAGRPTLASGLLPPMTTLTGLLGSIGRLAPASCGRAR